jgi:hypothetical protein
LGRINRNYDLARSTHITIREAAAALTALSEQNAALATQVAELTRQKQAIALDALAASGQAQEAYEAQLAAEAKVARLEGALRGLLSAVDAWAETPPRSDAEVAASFPVYAAAETARAALTEGDTNG